MDFNDTKTFWKIYKIVSDSCFINYKQLRNASNSGLNSQAWGEMLGGYQDKKKLQNLKYGFPLSITK